MARKLITLFTAMLHNEDSLKNFESILWEAKNRGYNVLTTYIGSGVSDGNGINDVSFYVQNIEKSNAVIIDGFKIINRGLISSITRYAEKKGVPVVLINDYQEDCHCLYYSVEKSFYEILNHLITTHGCRKIDLMLGYEHMWNSDELLSIYTGCMENSGLSYNKSRVVYGGYWSDKAKIAIEKLLEFDTPEAVVCANDAMAIETCRVLKSKGIRVPEDVIVTGIDGSVRSEFHAPSLTTIKKDASVMASRVFEDIEAIIAGEETERYIPIECSIDYASSCGCGNRDCKNITTELNKMYDQQERRISIEPKLFDMSRRLMEVSALKDISYAVQNDMPSDSFICVRESFMQDVFKTREKEDDADGDSSKMYILADNRAVQKTWTKFDVSEVFPEYNLISNLNVPIIVAPLLYEGLYFGFWVSVSPNYRVEASIYDRFITHINSLFARYIGERKLRFANSELFHINAQVKGLSERDAFTGMLNANGFSRELEAIKKHCDETNEALILICVDIDKLGNINNIYGHFEGDNAIQTLAKLLTKSVESSCVCAHLGGDEFVIALHTKDDVHNATDKIFRIVDGAVSSYNAVSGKDYTLGVNQCYYEVPSEKDIDMKKVLDDAFNKKRLMKANRDTDFKPIKVDDDDRRMVDKCINENLFKYAYQPIASAKTGAIYAYEALMRTKTDRYISPLTVLKHANETDRLYEIEKATFFNVFEHCYSNIEKLDDRLIFINSIPGYQLTDMDYSTLKRRYGSIFEKFVVEVTEQTEMSDEGFEILQKRSFEDHFEVAIDDFGSGYSNTSMLLKYLPKVVKIDRLLITDIHEDTRKQHFVNNIIEFAHNNGFMALAEGVETKEELKAVIHMGVDLLQGFCIAKPAFDFMEELPHGIVHDIIEANLDGGTASHKRMYVPENGEKEISVMKIALEQYAGIIIDQSEITLIGNKEFSAALNIKVKDNRECLIHLKNVRITSEDETPCIEVGNNNNVTIDVVGNNNELIQGGIRVPETSTVRFIGEGILSILSSGVECYGIGGSYSDRCGNIIVDMTGNLNIRCDGNKGIGIGAGTIADGSGIKILKGRTVAEMACVEGIGIGCVMGNNSPFIVFDRCSAEIVSRVSNGICIGCLEGSPQISVCNSRVKVDGSGTKLCAIGVLEFGAPLVDFNSCRVITTLNGRELIMIGSSAGVAKVSSFKTRMDIVAEGNDALGIGSTDDRSIINLVDGMVNITLRAGKIKYIGAKKENIVLDDMMENYSQA